MSKRRHRQDPAHALSAHLDDEATYVCDSCGEEIVVPVDASAGAHQDFVEQCPVCCNPMKLHVEIEPDGEARIEGEHEWTHRGVSRQPSWLLLASK